MSNDKIGFLNLNKPAGWTSHDCVAKVRRLLNIKRVGHGGTLDPSATGVLPIAVGKATRLLQFLPEEKEYHGRVRLGVKTTTDDLEGTIITAQEASQLTLDDIKPILRQFEGKIEQIPPAYSAIQRGGKRLYELARAGEPVEVPVRTVEIHKIEILGWYPGTYPEIDLQISCGSGTYIRAIARDLGELLGVGGTLAALTRTLSCGMKLPESLTIEQLQEEFSPENIPLIPPEVPLQHLPAINLKLADAQRWCQGQQICLTHPVMQVDRRIALVTQEDGNFLGIGTLHKHSESLKLNPKIVLL